MKSILLTTVLIITIILSCSQSESNSLISKTTNKMNTQEKTAITDLLKSYESALNASDTKSVLELYSDRGVFMPSEAPTSIGKEAIGAAYDFVFSQIKLDIVFSIDELEVHDDLAFARTISKGKTDVLAAGITVPEENRELFILKKENEEWKIARYIFNKMSPPSKN